jgi:hypothetical protein
VESPLGQNLKFAKLKINVFLFQFCDVAEVDGGHHPIRKFSQIWQ